MRTKKIVSVLLALSMIFGMFAIGSFAMTDDKVVKVYVDTDKTYVQPGDVVTVTISLELNPTNEKGFTKFQNAMFGVMFNNTQITPDGSTNTWHGTIADFVSPKASSVITAPTQINKIAPASTAEEQALITSAGLNAFTKHQAVKDAASLYGAQGYWEMPAEKEAYCTVEFTVADTVSDGDTITLTIPSGLFYNAADKTGAKQYYVASYTSKASNEYETALYDLSDATAVLTVGTPAPAGPAVALATNGQQAKFTDDGTGAPKDEFMLRIKSQITADDWDTYFANTGDAGTSTNKITNVGIVAYKGTTGFDAETAKAVVAGTAATGYEAKETDYVQHSDGTDAYFGAIIRLNHSTCDFDTTYMGYVKYLDADGAEQIIFYSTEAVAGTATNYNAAVNAWKAL